MPGSISDRVNSGEPGTVALTPGEINAAHVKSDVDTAWNAQHHTLGKKANQAAPGNHKHPEYALVGSGGSSPAGDQVYQVRLSANFTANPTLRAVGNLSLSIPVSATTDIWLVNVLFDTDYVATGTLTTQLFVDGALASPAYAIGRPVAGLRSNVGQLWRVTGLAAGNHTFEIRAQFGSSTDTLTIYANHSALTIWRPSGPAGPQGLVGPPGANGANGAQGPIGNTGPQGVPGPTGSQGPIGNTGATGPKGDTGDPGPQGPTGATGPQGPIGNTGPQGPQGPQGIQGPAGALPTGSIVMWGGSTAPSGWALCDGSVQTRTDPNYSALFAVIGISFNVSGETASQFRLPDLRNRFPIGVGTNGLGITGGALSATLIAANLPPHAHDMTHAHTADSRNVTGENTNVIARGGGAAATVTGNYVNQMSGSTGNGPGSSSPVNITPPYQALYYIIKL